MTALLDNMRIYKEIDTHDILKHLHDFPAECVKAYERAKKLPLPKDWKEVENIIVLGMGGSAIAGDLVSSIVANDCKVPIQVWRGYDLPAYVGEQTLVVASSYSGNTEETLACFKQSVKAGAKILVMTTGGKLKEMAVEHKLPLFDYDYKSPPRAALPYSFIPLLVILNRSGIITSSAYDIKETLLNLKERGDVLKENVPLSENPAKMIADKINHRLPIIYGAELVEEVAHRWKTQINENSKGWAFYEVFPELNHNAVVGYRFPKVLANKILVIMLSSEYLSPRVKLRYKITQEILRKTGVRYEEVRGEGRNQLDDIMWLILLGDYISYYLAMLYKIAPGPVEAIDYLKNELAKNE